jgi:hypothetical protein
MNLTAPVLTNGEHDAAGSRSARGDGVPCGSMITGPSAAVPCLPAFSSTTQTTHFRYGTNQSCQR